MTDIFPEDTEIDDINRRIKTLEDAIMGLNPRNLAGLSSATIRAVTGGNVYGDASDGELSITTGGLASIAYDSSASVNQTSDVSTQDLAHTCSGLDRTLIVVTRTTDAQYVTGVTYASVAMTNVATNQTSTTHSTIWMLVAPATGTNNITATLSSAKPIDMYSISLTGTLQTGEYDVLGATASSTETATATQTITTATDNAWVIAYTVMRGGTATPSSSTNCTVVQSIANKGAIGYYGPQAVAHNLTQSIAFGTVVPWVMRQISIKPTTGLTYIDLGGASSVVKNYSSISITGTGALGFTNPHANGTIITLKSQGDVTLTSSTVPCIDTRNMGASEGNVPTGTLISVVLPTVTTGGEQTGSGANTTDEASLVRRAVFLMCGGAGATGADGPGSVGGAGGGGAGALMILCGGALNFTGTINTSGSDGSPGIDGGGSNEGSGGGGGGSAGSCIILYNSLVANTGTITDTGGAGGDGGPAGGTTGTGGAGGGGAGSLYAAGGDGGDNIATPDPGNAAGGVGAGGGGGGAHRTSPGAGGAGGAGGASMGGFSVQNKYL